MEKHMELWEDLLGTLSGYTIKVSDPEQVSDGEAPRGGERWVDDYLNLLSPGVSRCLARCYSSVSVVLDEINI